jgi:CRISPR-associated protein Cmr5
MQIRTPKPGEAMNKIEKLLPSALEAAKKFITIDNEQLSVPKQFKGYISSFGASVIQSGLMPTLAFYSDAKKTKGNRSLLIPALIFILFENKKDWVVDEVKDALVIVEADETMEKLKEVMHCFFDWFLEQNKKSPEMLRKELMDASIALKLALRTFREVELKSEKS